MFLQRLFRRENTITLSESEAVDVFLALGFVAQNGLFPEAGLRWDGGVTLARLGKFLSPHLSDSAAVLVAATDQVIAAEQDGARSKQL